MLQVSIFAENLITPERTTRLTEDYPIEMPTLKAYPIYMNASIEEPNTIFEVIINIDGTDFPAVADTGFYYYLWTPDSYGNHEIIMTAKADNGDKTTIDLSYRFHPSYKDYCYPSNPDCISGQTYADCNDGSNPVYYVESSGIEVVPTINKAKKL